LERLSVVVRYDPARVMGVGGRGEGLIGVVILAGSELTASGTSVMMRCASDGLGQLAIFALGGRTLMTAVALMLHGLVAGALSSSGDATSCSDVGEKFVSVTLCIALLHVLSGRRGSTAGATGTTMGTADMPGGW